MPMISEKDSKAIRDHFAKQLKNPVVLDHFTHGATPGEMPIQECEYCRETTQLLQEVAALSGQITLRVHDFVSEADRAREMGVVRIPTFALSGKAKGRVRFVGIPTGYEFSSLIESLVDVANGTTDLSPKVADEIGVLRKDVHIQVFGTPT